MKWTDNLTPDTILHKYTILFGRIMADHTLVNMLLLTTGSTWRTKQRQNCNYRKM